MSEAYDSKEKVRSIVSNIEMGIMTEGMLEGIVEMDGSIPEFARERVIREVKRKLAK